MGLGLKCGTACSIGLLVVTVSLKPLVSFGSLDLTPKPSKHSSALQVLSPASSPLFHFLSLQENPTLTSGESLTTGQHGGTLVPPFISPSRLACFTSSPTAVLYPKPLMANRIFGKNKHKQTNAKKRHLTSKYDLKVEPGGWGVQGQPMLYEALSQKQ